MARCARSPGTGVRSARARAGGTIVSIDLDNVFPKLDELLPLVDILITSAELPATTFKLTRPLINPDNVLICCTNVAGCINPSRYATMNFSFVVA